MKLDGLMLADRLRCTRCAYDLRGLTSPRCPECGQPIDRANRQIIAWEHRASLGKIRAFFQTAVAATYAPIHLSEAALGTVNVQDARKFRWIACFVFSVFFSAVYVFEIWDHGGVELLRVASEDFINDGGSLWQYQFLWQSGAMLWPVLPIGFLIAMLLATEIAHWFYDARFEIVQANRAMALSYYLWLPFANVFLLAAALGVIINLRLHSGQMLVLQLISPAIAAVFLLTILNGFRAIRLVMKWGVVRLLLVLIGIGIQTIFAIALGLVVFPMMIGLFRLVIGSFR